jgi:hypothetical protein
MIAAYVLIYTQVGTAAAVVAARRDMPGVPDAASLARPYDVIVRVEIVRGRDCPGRGGEHRRAGPAGGLRIQALGRVARTITCPIIVSQ